MKVTFRVCCRAPKPASVCRHTPPPHHAMSPVVELGLTAAACAGLEAAKVHPRGRALRSGTLTPFPQPNACPPFARCLRLLEPPAAWPRAPSSLMLTKRNRFPPSRRRSRARRAGTRSTRSSSTPVSRTAPRDALKAYLSEGKLFVGADLLSGKILKDEETVQSYNIEEKGFVVCMVNKVRR